MAEQLTIFNEKGQPIGVKEREEVHRDGDWHETFHCWMFEQRQSGTYLLFQKRAKDKKDFPGLYDITAAGHMEAGVREIEEELGVRVDPETLIHVGDYEEELTTGDLIDREICRVHIWPCVAPPIFHIGEEVQDVVRIVLDEFRSLVEKEKGKVTATSVLTGKKSAVTIHDFVPHERGYELFIIDSVNFQC